MTNIGISPKTRRNDKFEISQIKEMTKRDFSSVEMTSEISQIKEMTREISPQSK
jgi:hypothetical protein